MSEAEMLARAMFEDEQRFYVKAGHTSPKKWEDVTGPQFRGAVADRYRRFAAVALKFINGTPLVAA